MRVVTAHHALQLGKLADHAREQIALGQARRARRQAGIDTDAIGDDTRDFRHAHALVPQAAEGLLVGDVFQRVLIALERRLQIFIPEKLRVGEARTDHALIAFADFLRLLAVEVGDADEVLGELAVRIEHRHEFLVGLHGRDQRFRRYAEEVAIERAGDGDRPLGEVGDLVEQTIIEPRRAAGFLRHARHFVANALAALHRVGQYLGHAHGIGVAVRIGQMHRLRMQETMAARLASAAQAQDLAFNDDRAMQHHQPVRRPHEAVVVIGPAHGLGNRQALERFLDDVRQQRRDRLARFHAAVDEPGALVGFQLFQLLHADAARLRETDQRLARLALRIQCGVHGRAAALDRLLRLRRSHLGNMDGQTPRCHVQARLVQRGRNAALAEPFADAVQERGTQFVQRFRRQFFGAQLNQQ